MWHVIEDRVSGIDRYILAIDEHHEYVFFNQNDANAMQDLCNRLQAENQRLRAFVKSVWDNGWLSKRSEGQPHELQMQARALLDSLDSPAAIE